MPNILSTDQSRIRSIDCNPQKQKKIIFEGSTLKIISGSETLYALDLSTFGQFGSEWGGSFKKNYYVPSKQTYSVFAGNISQVQGEVSMIVVMVNYDKSIPAADRHLIIEYHGHIFPCGPLMFLTGSTLDDRPWHGWDMDPEDVTVSSPVSSPNFDLGGLLIFNHTIGEVEVQILVMN